MFRIRIHFIFDSGSRSSILRCIPTDPDPEFFDDQNRKKLQLKKYCATVFFDRKLQFAYP